MVTLELVVCLLAPLEPEELVEIFRLLSSIGGVGIPLSMFGDADWVDWDRGSLGGVTLRACKCVKCVLSPFWKIYGGEVPKLEAGQMKKIEHFRKTKRAKKM